MSPSNPKSSFPLIIAHRGGRFWTGRRPNDFRYITESLRAGANVIELDVRVRAGQYVVRHDQVVAPYQGTLSEALKWVENAGVLVDVKGTLDLLDLIAFVRSRCENLLVVQSRSVVGLARPRDLQRVLFSLPIIGIASGISELGQESADWITPFPWFITRRLVQQIRRHGFKFVPGGNVFARSTDEALLTFAQWGAHALSTFYVDRLVKSLTLGS